MTVHGQSDQIRLRGPARQRALLDEYAGADHAATLARYREAWDAWLDARSGERVKPPTMGKPKAGYKALRDAPGIYVYG